MIRTPKFNKGNTRRLLAHLNRLVEAIVQVRPNNLLTNNTMGTPIVLSASVVRFHAGLVGATALYQMIRYWRNRSGKEI